MKKNRATREASTMWKSRRTLKHKTSTCPAVPITVRDVGGSSIEDQLKDIRHRLYKIEDKLDHVLYHHGHEVTPHKMDMTPFGMMMTPQSKNPNSAHNQLKMNDHMNPFNPMMGMHAGMMGMHPGMMGVHPGMMGVHPGMMGMMGMPYGLGAMNAYNYPDQQDVETEEAHDEGSRLKKRARKLKLLN